MAEKFRRFMFENSMLAIALSVISMDAVSAETFPLYQNVNIAGALYEMCAEDSPMQPVCLAYILGVMAGSNNGHVLEAMERGDNDVHPAFCAPPSVTLDTTVALFRAEVQIRPGAETEPSAVVLTMALRRAFPCGK